MAPDTTAAIFWLKNRKTAEWRDRVLQEHTGPGGGPIQTVAIDASDLSPEQREALRAAALAVKSKPE